MGSPSDWTGEQPHHQDAVLLDEPTTADLRSKVTDAWREFARALAALLPTLAAGAVLELILDPTASGTGDAVYSVTVHAESNGDVARDGDTLGEDDAAVTGGLVALAVGNAALPDGYRMDRTAVADLIALGWSPPGVVAGSGGSFGLVTAAEQASGFATIVTRTLRDIYGAPHPAFLVYLAHDSEGNRIPIEPLGTARLHAGLTAVDQLAAVRSSETTDVGGAALDAGDTGTGKLDTGNLDAKSLDIRDLLDEQVRTVVATLLRSDPDQLQLDSDGDISIRAGSAMVFVRVRDNPPLVDVISPVLTEVSPTERLYVKLSELTNRMPIGRLYCANDTVWASIPVFGRNFQATHLMLAIQVMTGLADELDDRLHGEFGGKRFFGEGDRPQPKVLDGTERTGMYL